MTSGRSHGRVGVGVWGELGARDSPAAAAMCSSTLSRSSQAAGCTSAYMSSVRMGAALMRSDSGAGDKLITWRRAETTQQRRNFILKINQAKKCGYILRA